MVGKKVLERTVKLNCATVAVWFCKENGRERRNSNRDDDLCSIVAVGSYEHRGERKGEDEEEVQRGKEEERIGQVTLFRCSRGKSEEEEEEISFDACGELDATSSARCGGAFDLKFGNASKSEGGKVELAMACANNCLEVFEMMEDGDADVDEDVNRG